MIPQDLVTESDVDLARTPVHGNTTSNVGMSLAVQYGLVIVVIASICVGFAYYQQKSQDLASEPARVLEQRGTAFIANQLRDPSSAQFRNVTVHASCMTGEVNGRNAFGGYTGFTDFYYDDRLSKGRVVNRDYASVPGSPAYLQEVLSAGEFYKESGDCIAGEKRE